jgi:hypothetical protein
MRGDDILYSTFYILFTDTSSKTRYYNLVKCEIQWEECHSLGSNTLSCSSGLLTFRGIYYLHLLGQRVSATGELVSSSAYIMTS